MSQRPTKEVLREVVKEVPAYKSTISFTSTKEENNQIIKVLEHESKVYNFGKTILGVVNPMSMVSDMNLIQSTKRPL